MDSREQQELSQALQQQAALMGNFAAVTHKCFNKCITKPGKTLSYSEESCVTNCVDRYSDTQLFLVERIRQQAELEKTKSGMVSH